MGKATNELKLVFFNGSLFGVLLEGCDFDMQNMEFRFYSIEENSREEKDNHWPNMYYVLVHAHVLL